MIAGATPTELTSTELATTVVTVITVAGVVQRGDPVRPVIC